MEITGGERKIDDINDSGNKNGVTFFKKPGSIGIGSVRLFVRTTQLERILEISDSVTGLEVEKSGGEAGGEGECRETGVELLTRERRSLDILSVKRSVPT